MLARGTGTKHAAIYQSRVSALFKTCKFKFLTDLQPGKVQTEIADLRKPKPKAAAAGDNPGQPPRMTKGMSLQTCNHTTTAAKAFTHWTCRDGRRALTDAEVNALITAAESGPYLVGTLLPGQTRPKVGPQTILGIAGLDRAIVYRVAVGTGFRKAEIESLTPESFNLDNDPPTITIRAGYSKHRREDIQPIRQDLADMLRTFVAGKPAGTPVFAMPEKAFKIMQADLASARATYVGDAATAAERTEREQSGFCLYADAAGRYADFHALRHTYITRLVKSNASVKVCQELARHSDPKLTFAVYSHVGMADTSRALDKLPGLTPPQAEKQTTLALRTGTDNLPVSAVAELADTTHGTTEIKENSLAFCLALSDENRELRRTESWTRQQSTNPHG